MTSVNSKTLTTTCVLLYWFSVDITLFEVPSKGDAGSFEHLCDLLKQK